MLQESTNFIIKLKPNTPKSIVKMFPSPNQRYVSIRNNYLSRWGDNPPDVNTVFYNYNGIYVPVQWKVHNEFKYIKLFWNPPSFGLIRINYLQSGELIYIIRPVFRILFWCIIKLKLIIFRVRSRLMIKKALRIQSPSNVLSIFSGSINYPIQYRILLYI